MSFWCQFYNPKKKNWLINGENNEQIKSLSKPTFYRYMIWNGSSLQKPTDCSCHLSSSMFLVPMGKESELHGTLNDPGWTTSVISSGVLLWPWTPGQMCVKCFLRESGDVWWFSNSTGVCGRVWQSTYLCPNVCFHCFICNAALLCLREVKIFVGLLLEVVEWALSSISAVVESCERSPAICNATGMTDRTGTSAK